VGVARDAVDDGGDEPLVLEDGSSFAERQVGRQPDGGFLIAFGDDLEQQLGATGVELDLAELVEQEQVEAAVASHDAGQLPVVGSFGELVDQLGGPGGLARTRPRCQTRRAVCRCWRGTSLSASS
jgi:hypothetical protein